MKNQNGLSLIQLIMVVIILGVLAVTAAPKFMNLQGNARHAVLSGLKSSIDDAMNITYAKAAIQGVESSKSNSITSTSSYITIQYGYPTASDSGIIATLENMDKNIHSDWAYPRTNTQKFKDHTFKLSPDPIDSLKKVIANYIRNNKTVGTEYNNGHCILLVNNKPEKEPNRLLIGLSKEECIALNGYSMETSKDPNKPIHVGPNADGKNGALMITVIKYKDFVNTPNEIPKHCYLTYIPAIDANTPAKVELSPTACLTD